MRVSPINNLRFSGVWSYDNENYTSAQNHLFQDIKDTMSVKSEQGSSMVELLERNKKGIAVKPGANNTVSVHLVKEGKSPKIVNIYQIGKYSKPGQFQCSDVFIANGRNLMLKVASAILTMAVAIMTGNMIDNRKNIGQNSEPQENVCVFNDNSSR